MPFAGGKSLTREEQAIIARARAGGPSKRSERHQQPSPEATMTGAYPASSPTTLALLGQVDALLKAPPAPPRWALLRVLSLLEESEQRM
jgi:hypothetical protein